MYIRNAQGQLMWIPPQGYTPPARQQNLPTLQALQQNMRQQMQRDQWAQFNAPPPQDNVYFHDEFSCYEGTPSNGYHSVAPPPSVGNHVNMMHRGQHPQQQQQPFNRMNPPIPQVINPSQMLMSPRNQTPLNVAPPTFGGPPSVIGFRGPPSVVGTSEVNTPLSPLHEEIKLVKEEFVPEPKITCMSTIFGSSIDMYKSKRRSKKVGLMNCDALNISVSSDDEEELAGDSLSYSSHPAKNRNVFQCNGVRGPGRKFDYYGETRSESSDSERDSASEASEASEASSENEDKEKLFEDSIDALRMDNMRLTENKYPRSYAEDTNERVVAPDFKETIGSYSTGGAVVEDDSIDNDSDVIDKPPTATDYASHTRKTMKQAERSHAIQERRDEVNYREIRDGGDDRDQESEFVANVRESRHEDNVRESRHEDNTRDQEAESISYKSSEDCENGPKVTNYFAAKNYPTFNRHIGIREEFPSFDEPDFPSFDEPANPSDGENDQQNANIHHNKADKTPPSKRVTKETRVERPLGNSQVMN